MSNLDKSTFNSLEKRYAVISIVILLMSSRKRTAPEGGFVDHPTIKNQSRWNEWEEEEPKETEEPMKEEPTPPKSSPQTKQVWKEKVTPSPSQEAHPSKSLSPRSDYATE
jgi:hypothetical protein